MRNGLKRLLRRVMLNLVGRFEQWRNVAREPGLREYVGVDVG